MRTLIQYLRQIFCKHEWETTEGRATIDSFSAKSSGARISILCRRCGWHKSFWKFL